MSATDVCLLYMTFPSVDSAEGVARIVVAERLAACMNMVQGMRSVYRWDGEVQSSEEVMALAKTTVGMSEALVARVIELHPYDEPCVVMLPVNGGSDPFMQWVRDSVG